VIKGFQSQNHILVLDRSCNNPEGKVMFCDKPKLSGQTNQTVASHSSLF